MYKKKKVGKRKEKKWRCSAKNIHEKKGPPPDMSTWLHTCNNSISQFFDFRISVTLFNTEEKSQAHLFSISL